MHFVLTIQVFLVFGGGKCPLKFLRYGTQTSTSPYVTLYVTIKMSIIFTARKWSLGWGNVFTGLSRVGSLYDVTFCLAAWSHVPFRGCGCLILCSFWGWGSSVPGTMLLPVGVSVGRPPRIRKAGGTHPPGMLSCYIYFLPFIRENFVYVVCSNWRVLSFSVTNFSKALLGSQVILNRRSLVRCKAEKIEPLHTPISRHLRCITIPLI